MAATTRNPGALAAAGVRDSKADLADVPNHFTTPTPGASRFAAQLARRFGLIASTASALAALAYGGFGTARVEIAQEGLAERLSYLDTLR